MYQRKQYIINKGFQLKTTFTIIGFIFIIVAILTVLIASYSLSVSKKMKMINEIEDNIVQVLTVPNPELNESNQKFSIQMAKNHATNMETLKDMQRFNTILIWVIILIVFIQGIVLYFVLIRQTHRIAGPLFVMTRYMKDIINGSIPENLRPLRDKDLLKDVYEVFQGMIESLRSRSGGNKLPPLNSAPKTAVKKAAKTVKKTTKK